MKYGYYSLENMHALVKKSKIYNSFLYVVYNLCLLFGLSLLIMIYTCNIFDNLYAFGSLFA